MGVVIHKGNADFGHYISLVNVNRNDPNRPEQKEDLWLEFDDWKVSKFDMKDFDDECFGSEDKDYGANLLGIEQNISKSAYILIYDKVLKSNIHVEFTEDNIKEKQMIMDHLVDPSNFKFENNRLETPFYNINKYIPKNFLAEIENSNANLILEQQLLGSSFTSFFSDVISEIDLPDVSIFSENIP